MSREIKRVPLDFDHQGPWPGYLNEDDHYDPPTGDGWQVWEDTSEGSPISPVFVNRDDLQEWISERMDCAPVAADAFISQGWAPSFVVHPPFGMFTGVQMAAGIGPAIEWQHVSNGDYHTIAVGTPIKHVETGITGVIVSRFPPPDGDYYVVTWDRGLPALLDKVPGTDPNKPMEAGCRVDGFEVLPGHEDTS